MARIYFKVQHLYNEQITPPLGVRSGLVVGYFLSPFLTGCDKCVTIELGVKPLRATRTLMNYRDPGHIEISQAEYKQLIRQALEEVR